MMSERFLRSLTDEAAELLAPSLRKTDTAFRAWLKSQFEASERQGIAQITPGAAVRALQSGTPAREFLRVAKAASTTLAWADMNPLRISDALQEYGKLSKPSLRALDARDRARAEAALDGIVCVLTGAVNESFAAVEADENRFLGRILGAEAAEEDGALSDGMLSALETGFGAAGSGLFPQESKAQLGRIRVLQSGSPLILDREWRDRAGTVWSFPVAGLVGQLYFDSDRQMLPRETRLLALASERWHTALARLEREQRLRGMSLRMLEVEELERRRIGRELHDDAGQSLVVIRLQLEMAEYTVPQDNSELRSSLQEIRELSEKTILSVRKLISELSPAVLEQLGLAAAVRQYVNRFQQSYDARVRISIGDLPDIHPRLALVIYRVLQECFTNISQHSSASHINVSLTSSDGEIRLNVEDDGVGFNVEEGLGRRNCYGLVGIRERVGLLGGKFAIQSEPGSRKESKSARGTKVTIQLPYGGDSPLPRPE